MGLSETVVFLLEYFLLTIVHENFSISLSTCDRSIWLFVLWIFWLSMQHCRQIATGSVENMWLCIRSVNFVIIYIDLMRNHSFSTHNTNNHMCLPCVRDDLLNF